MFGISAFFLLCHQSTSPPPNGKYGIILLVRFCWSEFLVTSGKQANLETLPLGHYFEKQLLWSWVPGELGMLLPGDHVPELPVANWIWQTHWVPRSNAPSKTSSTDGNGPLKIQCSQNKTLGLMNWQLRPTTDGPASFPQSTPRTVAFAKWGWRKSRENIQSVVVCVIPELEEEVYQIL